MVRCLICKKALELAKNDMEQVKRKKRGEVNTLVCSACQARILFEAKNKQKSD